MDILSTKFNFNSLSVKDLVEARDLFHVHLINKKNVIATAVGRYRIRKKEPWPNEEKYAALVDPTVKREARTLENSHVREYSWPCILVFVEKWEDRDTLAGYGEDDIVPRSIYMPDGRIVPICVIEAPRSAKVADDIVDTTDIVFPLTFVGGGFPLLIESQGVERIASIGCIVTDGNTYYALTNKHVVGKAGSPVFTKLKGSVLQIGISSGKQLGKVNFEEIYPDWKGKNLWINNDIGLIEIEDINLWKTEIIGIGEIEKLADLNTGNITLALISVVKPLLKENFPKVCAFGAVSGKMEGEIVGLFYRYKSVGGQEFISDFLISGPDGGDLETRFGDSGTVWLLESEIDTGKKKYYPFGVHWGQHTFIASRKESAFSYALVTNLTNTCVRLDVDVVRGWNLDQDYSWGKSGHFKIAAKSCELVSNVKLKNLLMANQKNIGYVDDDLLTGNVVSGDFGQARDKFVPLADVADIIWRSTRKADSANHFADIDEIHRDVFGGKSLLELCKGDENNVDLIFWLTYFREMDEVDFHGKPREGALPFRVWQMYNQMISSLIAGNLAEFICAGGTMAHYVGDACQPLHISHLHHGRNASEKNVHSDYETQMVDRKLKPLFDGVNDLAKPVVSSQLVDGSGKKAAIAVVQLMAKVHKNLPPEEICISFAENINKRGKYDNMWNDLGKKTIENVAWGCQTMATLWQSAWIAGNGDRFLDQDLVEIDQQILKDLYNDPSFVQSFKMADQRFLNLLV